MQTSVREVEAARSDPLRRAGLADTPQAETNLNAVVGAVPNSAGAQSSMQDLVEVLHATGMRKPRGSAAEHRAIVLLIRAVRLLKTILWGRFSQIRGQMTPSSRTVPAL